jgi:endo-1,4-beta-xylanase
MVSFSSLLLALCAVAGVFSFPAELVPRGGTPSETGTGSDGYYYSFWTDGNSYVLYTNEANGQYNVKWDGSGDFVAGKGWSTGSSR